MQEKADAAADAALAQQCAERDQVIVVDQTMSSSRSKGASLSANSALTL